MRATISILSILLCCNLSGQDTYVKIYDFFNGVSESARNLYVVDDELHILGRGDCDSGSCLHYYVLDLDGAVIRKQRYPDIWPTLFSFKRDSSIYMGGFLASDTLDDGYRVIEVDLDGNLLGTAKFDQYALTDAPGYDIDSYFPRGAIANDDKIVVYGDTRETDAINDNFRRGLLMYYNRDLSFDTLVFINPRLRDTEMWQAELDSEDNFVFLFDYDENSTAEDYRTIIRYDSEANELFRWEPPELYWETQLFIPLLITKNDNYLTLLSNNPDFNTTEDLISINQSGHINWRQQLDFSSVRVGPLALNEGRDGNILLAGLSSHQTFRGAHISKYNFKTGELIWDRAILDWEDETRPTARTTFFCIEELDDGTIIAVGTRPDRTMNTDGTITTQDDLYVVRLDADGCLEPGCGGLEQHVAGEPDYISLINHFGIWQYRDPTALNGFAKELYATFTPIDSSFRESRSEFNPTLEYIPGPSGEIRQTMVFRLEDEGRKIYFIEDWEVDPNTEVLLYDFTLEVGDLFISDYIDQPLEVIEIDTMRLTDRSKSRYFVLACTENPEQTITWIERIGSYHDVVWPPDFCSGDYGHSTLTCWYWHARLAHMNPEVDGCLLPTSTDDLSYQQLDAITIFPNPTSSRLTISSPELGIQRIDILDVQGQTQSLHYDYVRELQYDLQSYVPGLYFFSVHTEKGQVVKKVVVE